MATLKCTTQIKYVVRITFPDKKEYYLAPSVYKAEGISKGFYHVYENDVVSVTSEKNNRRIMIYSKNGTILRVLNG